MADFVAVLQKAIEALKDNSPENRERIYRKARTTIEAKLAAISPPPPQELAERQKSLLEEAIARVEANYAPPPPAPATDDELDNLLAELNASTRGKAQPIHEAEDEATEAQDSDQDHEREPESEVAAPAAEMVAPTTVDDHGAPDEFSTPEEDYLSQEVDYTPSPIAAEANAVAEDAPDEGYKPFAHEAATPGDIPDTEPAVHRAATENGNLDGTGVETEPDEGYRERGDREFSFPVLPAWNDARPQTDEPASNELADTELAAYPSPDKDPGGSVGAFAEPEDDNWTLESEEDSQHAPPAWGDRRNNPAKEPGSLAGDTASPFTRGAPPARRGWGRVVTLALLLVVLAAAGASAWVYRDDLAQATGYTSFSEAVAALQGSPDNGPAETEPDGEPEQAAVAPSEDEGETTTPASDQAATEPQPQKFTQRLLPDGQEVDEGPAGGESVIGEGTSVAAATQSEAPTGGTGEQSSQPNVAVGQKAIFYEERTNVSDATADSGTVVWSLVEESPGDNLPPEPAIRADATIPQKGLQLKLTIRRNADQSLPASHIIELIFLTPDQFAGGGINGVLRVAMKRSEEDTGSPLLGVPVKIADGFFLVALSDSRADLEINSTLMRRQSWIDIPIIYSTGRRALVTLEKGVQGEQIFQEALEAWAKATNEG